MARMKKGTSNLIIIAVAIIALAVAGFGFYKSTKDKTKRAQWSGLSNVPAPQTRYLPNLDLGNIGEDIRYTINRSSFQHTGDPDWRRVRQKIAGMHGINGTEHDHSLNGMVHISPPIPVDSYPMITVASGPNDNQNHETPAGTFLPAPMDGRKLTGRQVGYNYLDTPPRWGSLVGTRMTPYAEGGYEFPADSDVLDTFRVGQAYRARRRIL